MRIILASKSPRRRELLSQMYSDFEVIVSECDESLEGRAPRAGAELIAIKKGRAVLDMLGDSGRDAMIISSDTLVAVGDTPYGKPRDEEDAYRMLRALSGGVHNVHTGVAVHYRGRLFCGVDTTDVVFRALTDEEIYDYIKTGEPMDKAGSYGIQGLGGKFVEKICGNYDTVVGLSCELLRSLIAKALAE